MRRLLIAVVGVVILAACGGGKEEEVGVDEILAQTRAKTSALTSFHFSFAVENAPPGGQGLTLTFAEGDLSVPDQLHAEVAGALSGVPLESELVVLGEQHYLKDPLTGEWRALAADISPIDFLDPAKGVLAIIEGAQDLELAGSDEVGGADSYRLRGKVRASELTSMLGNEPSNLLVDLELWAGKDDFLLRRIRLQGPVSEGEPADVVRTVEVSAFDEPVTIEAPEVAG